MNILRQIIFISYFVILIIGSILTSYVWCQEETLIMGKSGNVDDPNADILQVSFHLLEDNSIKIVYVIEGDYVDKYSYDIGLYAYEENRTFGNIILGYYQQKKGVYYVDQTIANVKPLQYSIQGSTLTITGLTLSDFGNRYAFYANAQTAVEQNKQLVWVDIEPREGARKIIFPSPEPPQTTTSLITTTQQTTKPVITTTTQPTVIIPQSSSTTTAIIVIAIVVLLSGLIIWRSSSKQKKLK